MSAASAKGNLQKTYTKEFKFLDVNRIKCTIASVRPYLCDLTDEGLRLEARQFPFTATALWKPLRPALRVGTFDYVYCCDVLEHLPTQFVALAVDQLLRVAERGLFLSVALVPDVYGIWAGKPLHQTVQSYGWWRETLRELGEVGDARDLIKSATFLVRHQR